MLDLSEVATGPMDIDVAFESRGRSLHELAATLNGRLDLVVGEGRLHNKYIELIAADLMGYLIPGLGGSDLAQLNCFVARFAVREGIAVSQALLLDTSLTTTAGKGQIDLAKETADLTLAPRPKEESLFSLAIPVVIYGPLNDLHYDVKKEDAILGVAGAILGAAVLGPFGILIPFVSLGAGDENACVAALERPVELDDGALAEPESGGVLEDIVDELLDLF